MIAVWSAMLIWSLGLMFNFYFVIGLLYALKGIKLPVSTFLILTAAFWSALLIVLYFLFIHHDKYKTIIKKYKDEPKAAIRKGNIYVAIYMISSFIAVFLGFYLMMMRNRGVL